MGIIPIFPIHILIFCPRSFLCRPRGWLPILETAVSHRDTVLLHAWNVSGEQCIITTIYHQGSVANIRPGTCPGFSSPRLHLFPVCAILFPASFQPSGAFPVYIERHVLFVLTDLFSIIRGVPGLAKREWAKEWLCPAGRGLVSAPGQTVCAYRAWAESLRTRRPRTDWRNLRRHAPSAAGSTG